LPLSLGTTPRIGSDPDAGKRSSVQCGWLGGSEKQIAAAFATARTRRAMLVEADSLLSDRRCAVKLLTWMETIRCRLSALQI
jgi:hypothetical protein